MTGASAGGTVARVLSIGGPQMTSHGAVIGPVDRLLGRVGLHGHLAQDLALALAWGLAGGAVVGLALGPLATQLGVPITPLRRGAVLTLVVVQSAALSLRRLRPVTCLALVSLLQIAIAAVLPDQTTLRAGATLVVAYTFGTRLDRRHLVALVCAALVELVGLAALDTGPASRLRTSLFGPTSPGELPEGAWLAVQAANVVLVYVTPTLVGLLVAGRHHRIQLLRDREAATNGEHEARLAVALGAERVRMARELHDIAAHHLSGMVVQAAAAERLVHREPDAAQLAIATLRAEGREALASLRSMVGVLRERGLGADELAAPVPGLAGIAALVDRARGLGDRIELLRDGEAGELSTISDVAVYRILQEALANARQHAPGQPVGVLVRQTPTTLFLRVDNRMEPSLDQVGPRGGFGLVGMAERAVLAGGHVVAGPTGDGRWQVELSLPASAVPPASPVQGATATSTSGSS